MQPAKLADFGLQNWLTGFFKSVMTAISAASYASLRASCEAKAKLELALGEIAKKNPPRCQQLPEILLVFSREAAADAQMLFQKRCSSLAPSPQLPKAHWHQGRARARLAGQLQPFWATQQVKMSRQTMWDVRLLLNGSVAISRSRLDYILHSRGCVLH